MSANKPYIVGLTGGIATGKSTASHHLKELGAFCIDADAISHELMLPGGNRRFVLEHIENRRGESVGVAPGSGHVVRIPVPGEAIAPERIEFALLMRDLKG